MFVAIAGVGILCVVALIIPKKNSEPEKSDFQKQKDKERNDQIKMEMSVHKSVARSIREE